MTSNPTIKRLYDLFQQSAGISIDSRSIDENQIFWGIKGKKFDGNQFAEQAIEKGAMLAVTQNKKYLGSKNNQIFYVDDSLKALTALSEFHRIQCKFKIIAITGSNGKTTTKELCRAVLTQKYKTASTPGNFNNEIGVPLTLLGFDSKTEIGIVELGARKPGDVDYLCKFLHPDAAIITNFGRDHLETFLTKENVIKTNVEVLKYLKDETKLLFLNADDAEMQPFLKGSYNAITFGRNDDATYRGRVEQPEDVFVSFSFLHQQLSHSVKTKLTGGYNFANLMVAVAVGLEFDVDPGKIVSALEAYEPSANRSQVIQHEGNTILMDAYNANPDSMEPAIKNFSALQANEKWLILGDMLELGTYCVQEHKQIQELALKSNANRIIFVGSRYPRIEKVGVAFFDDVKSLKIWWQQNKPQQALILLKGSRGIALEKLIES